MTLYDKIERLRLAAAVLFDRGRVIGRGPIELKTDIAPLMAELDRALKSAIRSDFGGVLAAIKDFELEAKMHEDRAKAALLKKEDVMVHVEDLKQRVIQSMQKLGITERSDQGYSVTLVKNKGQFELTIR